MTRLPRVTGKKVVATLSKAGFGLVRVRGSHHFLQHTDGRSTVVPVHAGEVIGPGLMGKILKDAEMTRSEFESLLHE
jgi:predicted RNA binding protein YcfA (HicA-like mRNA interferase family)